MRNRLTADPDAGYLLQVLGHTRTERSEVRRIVAESLRFFYESSAVRNALLESATHDPSADVRGAALYSVMRLALDIGMYIGQWDLGKIANAVAAGADDGSPIVRAKAREAYHCLVTFAGPSRLPNGWSVSVQQILKDHSDENH